MFSTKYWIWVLALKYSIQRHNRQGPVLLGWNKIRLFAKRKQLTNILLFIKNLTKRSNKMFEVQGGHHTILYTSVWKVAIKHSNLFSDPACGNLKIDELSLPWAKGARFTNLSRGSKESFYVQNISRSLNICMWNIKWSSKATCSSPWMYSDI